MAKTSAVKRPRVGKNVLNVLGEDICTGTFKEDNMMPSESDLCLRYAVSRTVIREALNVLEAKGLVSRKSRVGTKVNPQSEWNLLDEKVLKWLGTGTKKANVLASVLEARRLIEPIAAELAAERATIGEIAKIENAWQMMVDAGPDQEKFIEADINFHKLLLNASHNLVFQQLANSFQSGVRHLIESTSEAAESHDEAIEIHKELVEALRMRDKYSAKTALLKMLDLSARDLAIAAKKSAPLVS
jgi:DNA-binding FadR family transcriptional regulator